MRDGYVDQKESIGTRFQGCIEKSIEKIAYRFMEENPPEPFMLYTYDKNGVSYTKEGKLKFLFDSWFPNAGQGEIGVAAGDFLSHEEKESRFSFLGAGESKIFLNERNVLEIEGRKRATFTVKLKKGWNRLLILTTKASGFSCVLENLMPQWEPYFYKIPFGPGKGEAGYSYGLLEKEMEIKKVPEDMQWYPLEQSPKFPGRDGEDWYFWSSHKIDRKEPEISWKKMLQKIHEIQKAHPEIEKIFINGREAKEKSCFQPGEICQITWFCKNTEGEDDRGHWRTLLKDEFWQFPLKTQGNPGRFLLLGPLGKQEKKLLECWQPGETDFLQLPFRLGEKSVFWKLAYEGKVIRPYVQAPFYGRWTYPLGVTLYGIWKTGIVLKNKNFTDYVLNFVKQIVLADAYGVYDRENYGFPGINQQLLWLDALDDCGSFGSCMLECVREVRGRAEWKDFVEAAEKIAHRIFTYMMYEQPRNPDGSFKRRDETMWVDDLYMSIPFLIRYGTLFRKQEAFQEAIKQLLLYRKRFYFRPEGMEEGACIFSHIYKAGEERANEIPWSRGNGWILFSLSEVFEFLDCETEICRELRSFYLEFVKGCLRFQDENGFWHQIIDEDTTYPEISGTAMFLCAMARGVQNGILPPTELERCKKAVESAWKGIIEKAVDKSGNLYGVCQGSGCSYEREYYRKLMWKKNDTHGIGIVLLAGTEIKKMREGVKA